MNKNIALLALGLIFIMLLRPVMSRDEHLTDGIDIENGLPVLRCVDIRLPVQKNTGFMYDAIPDNLLVEPTTDTNHINSEHGVLPEVVSHNSGRCSRVLLRLKKCFQRKRSSYIDIV